MNSRSRAALVLRLALNNASQYEIRNTPSPPQHLSQHEHESDGPGYIECLEPVSTNAVDTPPLVERTDDIECVVSGHPTAEAKTPLSKNPIEETASINAVDTPPLVEQTDDTDNVPHTVRSPPALHNSPVKLTKKGRQIQQIERLQRGEEMRAWSIHRQQQKRL